MAIQNASSKEIKSSNKNHQVTYEEDNDFIQDNEGKVGYENINGLYIGNTIMIKERPCKIEKMQRSAPGKHGAAKFHVYAKDLFTDRRYEKIISAHDKVEVPEMIREEYQVLSIDGKYLSILNLDTFEQKDSFEVEDENLLEELEDKMDQSNTLLVTVLSFGQEELIISYKLEQ